VPIRFGSTPFGSKAGLPRTASGTGHPKPKDFPNGLKLSPTPSHREWEWNVCCGSKRSGRQKGRKSSENNPEFGVIGAKEDRGLSPTPMTRRPGE